MSDLYSYFIAFSEAAASEYEITGSIQAMFICTAVILSSDSLSALFQGSDSLQAALIVRVCTFVMFLASFMMAGLMTGYITRLLPSTKGKYVRYAVGGMSILAALILIWNLSSRKIYTFTAEQRYLRGEWFALTQYFGLAAVAIDGFYIIRCRK